MLVAYVNILILPFLFLIFKHECNINDIATVKAIIIGIFKKLFIFAF